MYILNICSSMAYSLDPYLNPITTPSVAYRRTCFISLVLVSFFLLHRDSALSPLSSSMYVGRVLIKLSGDWRALPSSCRTAIRRH